MRTTCRVLAAAAVALCVQPVFGEDAEKTKVDRKALIARAQVWRPTDVASMDMKAGPPGFEGGPTVTCDYVDKKLSGASPKFACTLPSGEELKIKYGGSNGEVYAEVAASRLLWALGFGADHMYPVEVICHGCPRALGGTERGKDEWLFEKASLEQKMPGQELSGEWDWTELDQVNEAAGGAPRAHRDALKLLAVLLQHTDSKPIQQRIVCLEEGAGTCATPMMMVSDLGLTFGAANMFNKQSKGSVNFTAWEKLPIWKEGKGCVGNLSGSITGTLKEPVISEAGRQFLSDLLMQLSDQQLTDMFEAARIHLRGLQPKGDEAGTTTVAQWVDAFKNKRAQIVAQRCAA